MALYQFFLAIIPKKGIVEYFGEIPKKIEVDFQKRTEFFLNEEIEDEFDYFEFIQQKCWQLSNIESKEMISRIDQKLDRASWGDKNSSLNIWKTETEYVDNDACILINEERSQIEGFTFRADLRQPKLKFLIDMVELSKEKELLLIDRKGNLVEPEIEDVIGLIKKSNALRFLENPIKYLTDLGEGKIQIE